LHLAVEPLVAAPAAATVSVVGVDHVNGDSVAALR